MSEEVTRIAVLETRVDNLVKDHAAVLLRVDKMTDALEILKTSATKMQVYVKVLWPTISVTLTIIGILVGHFVL